MVAWCDRCQTRSGCFSAAAGPIARSPERAVAVAPVANTWHHATVTRRQLRLGIDLDGVVADFNGGWTKLHNAEFGSTVTPDHVTMWDGLHHLGGFDDMDAFWDWARGNEHRPSIFRHLELLPDALETLHALAEEGHQIVIVSTKPDWAIHETMHWLADHQIPTREVHLTFSKHLVDCDVYLDDAPGVLPDLVEHHPDALVCRYVRPWNDPIDGTTAVNNWAEFHALVTQRSSSRVTDAAD